MFTDSTSSTLGSNLIRAPAPTGMLANNMSFADSMMPNTSSQRFHPLTDNTKIAWAVAKEEKEGYTKVFKEWDTENSGCITRDKAKMIFSQSGLPQNVLTQIWYGWDVAGWTKVMLNLSNRNLSDINKLGKLNLDEFAVAMHLVYRKLNGQNVPTTLPPELVPTSTRELQGLETAAKNSVLQGIAQKKKLEQFNSLSTLSPPRMSSSLSSSTYRSNSSSPGPKRNDSKSDTEDDIGYVSSARHLVPSRSHSANTSPTPPQSSYGYRSKTTRISDLRKQIKDCQDKIRMLKERKQAVIPMNELPRREQADIEDLKDKVRQIHEHLARTSDKDGQQSWQKYEQGSSELSSLAGTQKSISSEIKDTMNTLEAVMSRIKETGDDLKKKKIEAINRQTANKQAESAIEPSLPLDIIGTGPNGEVTKEDRIKAKAKAMVAARLNKDKSKPTSSSPDVAAEEEIRMIEEDCTLFEQHIKDETRQLQEQRQVLEKIELGMRMTGLDIHNEDYTKDMEERLRFEQGAGVAPDLRLFIQELAVATQVARAPDPDPTFESRFPSFE